MPRVTRSSAQFGEGPAGPAEAAAAPAEAAAASRRLGCLRPHRGAARRDRGAFGGAGRHARDAARTARRRHRLRRPARHRRGDRGSRQHAGTAAARGARREQGRSDPRLLGRDGAPARSRRCPGWNTPPSNGGCPAPSWCILQERRPFAIWQNQGKFVLIDRNGQIVANQNVAEFRQLPLVVGAGAPAAAAVLIDALTDRPDLQKRVVAAVRVGERRWNLRLNNGADVMLPEGHEVAALDRLMQLQQQHALLDRPLAAIDMRLAIASCCARDRTRRSQHERHVAPRAAAADRAGRADASAAWPQRTVRRARHRHHQDRLPDRPHRKRRHAARAWLRLAEGPRRARRRHRRSRGGREGDPCLRSARPRTWPTRGFARSPST